MSIYATTPDQIAAEKKLAAAIKALKGKNNYYARRAELTAAFGPKEPSGVNASEVMLCVA